MLQIEKKINPKNDEFEKNRIEHIFGVLRFVFGMTYCISYQCVRQLNTKHEILNTLVKRLAFRPFTKPSTRNPISRPRYNYSTKL